MTFQEAQDKAVELLTSSFHNFDSEGARRKDDLGIFSHTYYRNRSLKEAELHEIIVDKDNDENVIGVTNLKHAVLPTGVNAAVVGFSMGWDSQNATAGSEKTASYTSKRKLLASQTAPGALASEQPFVYTDVNPAILNSEITVKIDGRKIFEGVGKEFFVDGDIANNGDNVVVIPKAKLWSGSQRINVEMRTAGVAQTTDHISFNVHVVQASVS